MNEVLNYLNDTARESIRFNACHGLGNGDRSQAEATIVFTTCCISVGFD